MLILATNEKQTENILKYNIYNTNELHKKKLANHTIVKYLSLPVCV